MDTKTTEQVNMEIMERSRKLLQLQELVIGRIEDTVRQMALANPLGDENEIRMAAVSMVLSGLNYELALVLGVDLMGGVSSAE